MKKDAYNRFESLINKWCKNYDTVLKLISSAEQGMQNAMPGTQIEFRHSLSRAVGISDSEDAGQFISRSDGSQLCFTIYLNDDIIYWRKYSMSNPVTYDFMRAETEKWILEVDAFFFEVLSHIFTTGVNQISKVSSLGKNEFTEAEDVESL